MGTVNITFFHIYLYVFIYYFYFDSARREYVVGSLHCVCDVLQSTFHELYLPHQVAVLFSA